MEQRLSKCRVLCVVLGARQATGPGSIAHHDATFFYARRHLAGSDQPAGHLDRCGLSDSEVRVRVQSDERCAEYAPRITYSLDAADALKLGALVCRAASRVRARDGLVMLAALVEELGAVEVDYACAWTYRRVMGEPADA